ncbi:hypothetical protein [Nocardia beijingensis]|uniref:hypothetical protein n=1 Tax=Nocardia beijingensis TaxID=95162 RepID=UPI001893E899|nr:hypothetical protein [Nocardia beijingensis]MBF6076345.1 hypothetical protein [Nocardia beijingensis]
MLYNPPGVLRLIGDLDKYHADITAEREKAENAATLLVRDGWQSGEGGAAGAFLTKHKTLIADLDDLLGLLKKGRDNVQAALDKARATDQHVADDFIW